MTVRRDRLERALADFDAASITTTHGFCQEVLGGLGVAGDIDRGFAFGVDARDLANEVLDDLYVRGFLTWKARRDRRFPPDFSAAPHSTRLSAARRGGRLA